MDQRTTLPAHPVATRSRRRLLPLLTAGALAVPLGAALASGTTPGTAAASTSASSAPTNDAASLERRLRDPRIEESSGLARSTYPRSLLWTHNDSGDRPRLFAIGPRGATRAVLRLAGAEAQDWEDIAAGPDHTVWVGDIGDNDAAREQISVYRIREPRTLTSTRVRATRFRLAYPDGPHDAETLLVRPRSGRVLLVTKSDDGAGVYRAPRRLRADRVNRLTRVADAPAGVTAGSFSPDGGFLVLGTEDEAYGYRKVGGTATPIALPARRQGESVAVRRGRRAIVVGSEGVHSPVYRVPVPAALRAEGTRATADRSPAEVEGWALDLDENFDELDPARWNVRDRTYNSNEHSYLIADNTSVRDGALVIEARPESAGGRQYTSGYVDTNRRYSLPDTFRAEVRARVPMEQGLWAAPLWFRPTDGSAGEIDLIETYGRESARPLVHQTIHTGYGLLHRQSALTFPYARLGDPAGTGWHTYVVEKTPGQIVMSVDGVTTATWRSGDPRWFDRFYEAGKRWNLRINLQVGGSWGGLPDASTDWSQASMAVDYLRTWVPE
ncbi:family 16 glycosylhydrolase [Nocardioides sp. dk4132]|uniref:glycoside hydrolase family 16 protein n=1 Tax=unclassified Nocardioides TaxID=2615069 RepID=UPI00129530A9|nr:MULTISPECIES: glycoside hydrolase family 16 protein [unclassified Nocardioides]MQW74773.1 family 16 glycosylhydrolase [Nocardioides sp. dk4132]QGA06670.1 family 16 glycosylhydrolase [Nocardioides sp. dk884]